MIFRTPLEGIEHPEMEADVVIVGGGPAGMACALRLAQLIDAHNTQHPDAQLSKENIYVLEKAREIGQHCLSGAVLDPRSMDELLPEWRTEAPLEAEVTSDSVYYLTRKWAFKAPITPPPMQDHGNYVISLNRFTKWLGEKVEAAGITLFSGFAGSELLLDGSRVAGVRTDDKGVDKNNRPKSNFEPGYDLKAKVTILAEGTRGSLTKQLCERLGLTKQRNPMTYGVGVKELWELPAGRVQPGEVIYTMGYPLTTMEYGGAWIYGGSENPEAKTPRSRSALSPALTIPIRTLIRSTCCSRSSSIRLLLRLLEGGKMVRYGAKTMPNGGWWAMPPLGGDGWMIVGDAAGFLNSQRLKGIHLAIKSGMLAAETAFEALTSGDSSAKQLAKFQQKVESSWIRQELYPVRNFHQGFEHGFVSGILNTGLLMATGGHGLRNRYPAHAGYERMRPLWDIMGYPQSREQLLGPAKGDGKLTFDKLTDLYHSGTRHEEDQPAHLIIHDTDICNTRCTREYGNPCQHFCPANVYEMVEDADAPGKQRIHPPQPSQLRALQNLRHHGPLPDHHLGTARGRRRAQLRWHVASAPVDSPPTE